MQSLSMPSDLVKLVEAMKEAGVTRFRVGEVEVWLGPSEPKTDPMAFLLPDEEPSTEEDELFHSTPFAR